MKRRNPTDHRSACMDWLETDPTYRFGVDQATRTAVMELAGNGGVFLTGKPRAVAEYAQAIYYDFMRSQRARRNPQESFDARNYPTDRAAREARDARARAIRADGTTVAKWALADQESRAGDLAWKDGKAYRHTAGSTATVYGLNYARSNPSRMADARARLAAAREGYAMLTRAHGGDVVGWQEYKRAVAGMSPAAILAEARASAGDRSNPRAPKKEDRATKAVRRVTEAFKAGVILHWRGRTADGRRDDQGTAGYYRSGGRASHSTGTAEYAILGTPGRGGRDATFDTAFGAADHLVEWIGVTNAIDALKAAARKHGTEYANLDTSIRWGR